MLYIKQIMMIFAIAFLCEGIKFLIPLPIPASIYGMLILFLLLQTKIIKLDQIKKTGSFLIDVMPIMFIPAAKAMEMGETEGAMSSLAIVISGVTTVGVAILFSYIY